MLPIAIWNVSVSYTALPTCWSGGVLPIYPPIFPLLQIKHFDGWLTAMLSACNLHLSSTGSKKICASIVSLWNGREKLEVRKPIMNFPSLVETALLRRVHRN
ncbi:hypothetical protein CHS0354_010825 [Potamilus streckersoni]|uniref:Uncharacterized protein n=1 Tax=Potamilus streckersoni TaxID=2493646 RepID=A0AAE0TAB0_9BIVA|nr:hypothetical protein CHS0354_010825 [Potamilus streckersoni]